MVMQHGAQVVQLYLGFTLIFKANKSRAQVVQVRLDYFTFSFTSSILEETLVGLYKNINV